MAPTLAMSMHASGLGPNLTRPLATDKPRPEHPQSELRPHQRAYWEQRAQRPVGIGHCFKYPYGFYGLMELAQDMRLKQQCIQTAYHIL